MNEPFDWHEAIEIFYDEKFYDRCVEYGLVEKISDKTYRRKDGSIVTVTK